MSRHSPAVVRARGRLRHLRHLRPGPLPPGRVPTSFLVREPEREAGSCTKNGHAGARERGATLIIALVFITVLFSLIAVLFGFSLTATRTITTYRLDRTLRYAADGALEVGIGVVQQNPALGVGETPVPCGLLPVSPDPTQVTAEGSVLRIQCQATPGASPVGGERDVTFTVICDAPDVGPDRNEPYPCIAGPQTNERVLARARVRFEVDPGAGPPTERAVVPKIVTWTICRSSGAAAGTPELCDP